MNLVLLLSIILAVQLPLLTYGKASLAKVDSTAKSTTSPATAAAASPKSDETKAIRMRRNSIVTSSSDDADFSINRLSCEFPIEAFAAAPDCNEWNSDVKSRDRAIRDKMRNFFDVSCSKKCRQKVMYDIFAIQQCFNNANDEDEAETYEIPIERLRRAKLDVNDMFMPVRGRRTKPTSDIVAEKKAPLDLLKNDLFMPNRGRRDFPKLAVTPLDFLNMKRNGIDLNTKDYFMPNRGRRQPSIDSIISENFFPQRGKKSSPYSEMVVEMPPWLVPNRPRVLDMNMIDLLQDLNQFMNEANKDITAAVQLETAATTTTTKSGDEKFIPLSQPHRQSSKNTPANTMMIFKPTNDDESTEMFKIASDGDGGPANSIFTNTPFDHQQQHHRSNALGRVITSKFI